MRRDQAAGTVTLASLAGADDDDAGSDYADDDQETADVDFALLDESLPFSEARADGRQPAKRSKHVDVEAEAERLLGIQ